VIVLVIVIVGIIAVSRQSTQRTLQLASTAGVARLRHLRSGEFPSSCSWCKNTALARKLIMFERSPESWQVADVMFRLESCPEDEVEEIASALQRDLPGWRRICTEKCAKEFFAVEHVTAQEAFVSCAYCSGRAPAALVRCPHCGAART